MKIRALVLVNTALILFLSFSITRSQDVKATVRTLYENMDRAEDEGNVQEYMKYYDPRLTVELGTLKENYSDFERFARLEFWDAKNARDSDAEQYFGSSRTRRTIERVVVSRNSMTVTRKIVVTSFPARILNEHRHHVQTQVSSSKYQDKWIKTSKGWKILHRALLLARMPNAPTFDLRSLAKPSSRSK